MSTSARVTATMSTSSRVTRRSCPRRSTQKTQKRHRLKTPHYVQTTSKRNASAVSASSALNVAFGPARSASSALDVVSPDPRLELGPRVGADIAIFDDHRCRERQTPLRTFSGAHGTRARNDHRALRDDE